MEYPSSLDLLIFFGTEPIHEEDFTTYEVHDESGSVLSFSFDTSDDSVQTVVKRDGQIMSLTSNECLKRMWIDGDSLRAECECGGYRIKLELTLRPCVHVKWSGLRMR